jgi:predicted Fe-S protein YdhL (DUF1289 family)
MKVTHRTRQAMCQNCTRTHLVCELLPDETFPLGLCPTCGGSCWDCPGCMRAAMEFAAGEWSGLQPHARQRAISWTPEGGLVERQGGTDRHLRAPGEAPATEEDPRGPAGILRSGKQAALQGRLQKTDSVMASSARSSAPSVA